MTYTDCPVFGHPDARRLNGRLRKQIFDLCHDEARLGGSVDEVSRRVLLRRREIRHGIVPWVVLWPLLQWVVPLIVKWLLDKYTNESE